MSKPYKWKTPYHFRDRASDYPEVIRMSEWPTGNREFYHGFLIWLRQGGYRPVTVGHYGTAARIVLGFCRKPHAQLEEADLAQAQSHLTSRPLCHSLQGVYRNGFDKFRQYLRVSRGLPANETNRCRVLQVNWGYYLKSLPEWLGNDVKMYVMHCRKNWQPTQQHYRSQELTCRITISLRWMATHGTLNTLKDITPNLWDDFVAARLEANVRLLTLNSELQGLQSFLRFLVEIGRPVCERMLRMKLMPKNQPIPRDIPPEQLQRVWQAIEEATHSTDPTTHSLAVMDKAWFLLMLHSGLRKGEVRRLRLEEIDWERHWLRVEKSKGLKDRLVPLSATTIEALLVYLAEWGRLPGSKTLGNDFVFIH